MPCELRHQIVKVNGVQLHLVSAGPENGPPVILLHGFPEFWWGWRHQVEALAAAGYHVLLPDQRGYNLSDKPARVSAYAIDALARDILSLADIYGYAQFNLTGHGWGSAVAWQIAIHYPQRLRRLIILNGPHPAVMQAALRHSLSQLLKSWYIFAFQIPYLPEWQVQCHHFAQMKRALRASSRAGIFSDADLDVYSAAWSQPGAVTAMLNWYRAAVQFRSHRADNGIVHPPALILWGKSDQFLNHSMASDSLKFCENGRLILFENASHWLQHDEPERVNKSILEFL